MVPPDKVGLVNCFSPTRVCFFEVCMYIQHMYVNTSMKPARSVERVLHGMFFRLPSRVHIYAGLARHVVERLGLDWHDQRLIGPSR